MCSIMGIEKSQFGKQHMRQHFYKSIHRGPDDTRIKEYGNTVLGFHRLAIMGLHKEGMQPFERDELAIVCNGEIYGFRSIKKKLEDKYQFKSESDCEEPQDILPDAAPNCLYVVCILFVKGFTAFKCP